MNPLPVAPLDALWKAHRSEMGYTVIICETARGTYRLFSGGRAKGKEYKGLRSAMQRFDRECYEVEALEARLKNAGCWHPIRLCAGGCGLEMRVTPRILRDGSVVTVEEIMQERIWCVECGSTRTFADEAMTTRGER